MKHPKSSDARYIGDYFISIANKGGGKVVMSNAHITKPYLAKGFMSNYCNTTACHGGWYALGHTESEFQNRPDLEGGSHNRFLVDKRTGLHVRYWTGADLMAKKLGLSDQQTLVMWARENPEIWGNINGGNMFHGETAFWPYEGYELTLRHIGKHWLGVANRLEELESRRNLLQSQSTQGN